MEENMDKLLRNHKLLRSRLHKDGFQGCDRNCQFRAVCRHTDFNHESLRRKAVEELKANKEFYKRLTNDNVEAYCNDMKRVGVHGDELTVRALATVVGRVIKVYCTSGPESVEYRPREQEVQGEPISLAHFDVEGTGHYDACDSTTDITNALIKDHGYPETIARSLANAHFLDQRAIPTTTNPTEQRSELQSDLESQIRIPADLKVLDFYDRGNPNLDPNDLPKIETFREIVAQDRPGFSRFARTYPREFKELLEKLQNECPGAFEVRPPNIAKFATDILQKTYLYGRCQSGKTNAILTLAWLHFHFLGVYTIWLTWCYKASAMSSAKSIENFNQTLTNWLKDINGNLDPKECGVLFGHRKEYQEGRREEKPTFWTKGHKDNPRIIATLGNIKKLKALDEIMKHDVIIGDDIELTDQVLKKKRKNNEGMHKCPVLLIVDEDDEATSHFRRKKTQKEVELFQNLVPLAFGIIAVSATFAASAIGDAHDRDNGITWETDFVELPIPKDYFGLDMVPEDRNIPIRALERADERSANPTPAPSHEESDNWKQVIEDGCNRFVNVDGAKHQHYGNVVCQLFIPKDTTQEQLNKNAEEIAGIAAEYVNGKPEASRVPVLVLTFHANEKDGNQLFYKLPNSEDNNMIKKIIKEMFANLTEERFVFHDWDDGIRSKLPGSLLTSHRCLDIFKNVYDKYVKAKEHKLSGLYCAIVAHKRAGRSITFKDSKHELHLTDLYFNPKREGSERNMVDDGTIQAVHRIAGRYPHYINGNEVSREPPLTVWMTETTKTNVESAIKYHKKEILDKLRDGREPFRDPAHVDGGPRKFSRRSVQKGVKHTPAAEGSGKCVIRNKDKECWSIEEASAFAPSSKHRELKELVLKQLESEYQDHFPKDKHEDNIRRLILHRTVHFSPDLSKFEKFCQSWKQELDQNGKEDGTEKKKGKNIPPEAQKEIARELGLSEHTGIHRLATESNRERRCEQIPRRKQVDDATSVACWLTSDNSSEQQQSVVMIKFIDLDRVREQRDNYSHRSVDAPESLPIIYWYPKRIQDKTKKFLSQDEICMILAVDLPEHMASSKPGTSYTLDKRPYQQTDNARETLRKKLKKGKEPIT